MEFVFCEVHVSKGVDGMENKGDIESRISNQFVIYLCHVCHLSSYIALALTPV